MKKGYKKIKFFYGIYWNCPKCFPKYKLANFEPFYEAFLIEKSGSFCSNCAQNVILSNYKKLKK